MRRFILLLFFAVSAPLAFAEFYSVPVMFYLVAYAHWDTSYTESVSIVVYSSDRTIAARAMDDRKSIKVWNAVTGEEIATFPEQQTNGLAFSPDGKTLASGHGLQITLWDLGSKEKKGVLLGQGFKIAFSPDGKTLASADFFGMRVRLWDLGTSKQLPCDYPDWLHEESPNYVTYLRFSPDGKTLAAGNESDIGFWDVTSGAYTVRSDLLSIRCFYVPLLIGIGLATYLRYWRRPQVATDTQLKAFRTGPMLRSESHSSQTNLPECPQMLGLKTRIDAPAPSSFE